MIALRAAEGLVLRGALRPVLELLRRILLDLFHPLASRIALLFLLVRFLRLLGLALLVFLLNGLFVGHFPHPPVVGSPKMPTRRGAPLFACDMVNTVAEAAGMAYREAGDPGAPAVLFVHGYPESSFMWRAAMSAVGEAGWRAVAPDLPGYGDSEPPDGPATWESHVESLERFRAELGL